MKTTLKDLEYWFEKVNLPKTFRLNKVAKDKVAIYNDDVAVTHFMPMDSMCGYLIGRYDAMMNKF
jgi:hypothetical protein